MAFLKRPNTPGFSPEDSAAEKVVFDAFIALVVIVIAALGLILGIEIRHRGSAAGVAGAVSDMVTSALGLIGTLAGLVTGHRLGASGRKHAEEQRDNAKKKRDDAVKALATLISSFSSSSASPSTPAPLPTPPVDEETDPNA
jgi:hypothetical protein